MTLRIRRRFRALRFVLGLIGLFSSGRGEDYHSFRIEAVSATGRKVVVDEEWSEEAAVARLRELQKELASLGAAQFAALHRLPPVANG